MGNTLQEVEQIGLTIGPELVPLLNVIATVVPGAAPLGMIAQLLGPLFMALKATNGNVAAVANHLDPSMPSDPRLANPS